ncbi:MAG: DUF4340 domain-containing protein [Burkholderiales bacterium]|nr:DUF4340 domain-containing protein [Burkholderiales bacterium]
MNSRTVLNFGLLAAVAAAALALYLTPRQDAPQSYSLVPVAPEQIRRIDIERAPATTISLARAGDQWRMRTPVAARLDDTALSRVLELARLRSAQRLPAQALTRYGLDQPWGSIRFDDHRIDFGMSNTLTQEVYAKSGEHVYMIPARALSALPSTPAKLIAHRMFGSDEHPVAFGHARFTLRHDGERWQLDPADPNLSQDDLVRWVDQWRMASSILTQPQPNPAADFKDRIEVTLRDGRALVVGVAARQPDLVLVRADEGLAYHFAARAAQMLLATPSEAATRQP